MINRYPAAMLLLAAVLVMVQGCGQKGPLYLPGDPEQRDERAPAGSRAN